MHKRRALLTILAVAIAGVLAHGIPAAVQDNLPQSQSEERKTVWDGVYTVEEAERGQEAFERNCAACHAAEDGRQPGAGFTGTAFMERWGEYNLRSLFRMIRDTMPRDTPASLSDGTYLDIVARILEVNSFPAGDQALALEALGGIQIERQDGPQPIPSGSLAQLIGCLVENEGSDWILTNASEPARTDRARGSTDEELEEAEVKPLGTHTFGLQGFGSIRGGFTPDDHRGQKMQVKGYLTWLPEGQRIDLLSLETIAPTCVP